jgi:hypothetical protein
MPLPVIVSSRVARLALRPNVPEISPTGVASESDPDAPTTLSVLAKATCTVVVPTATGVSVTVAPVVLTDSVAEPLSVTPGTATGRPSWTVPVPATVPSP